MMSDSNNYGASFSVPNSLFDRNEKDNTNENEKDDTQLQILSELKKIHFEFVQARWKKQAIDFKIYQRYLK